MPATIPGMEPGTLTPATTGTSATLSTGGAPVAPPDLAALESLVARLERAARSIESATQMAAQALPAAAIAVDSADELVARLRERGVDVDQRARLTLDLVERLTRPDAVRVLGALLDRLPQLEQLLAMVDQAPGMLAMGVDAVDELVADLRTQGVDVERGVLGGAGAALRFGAAMDREKVESIAALLDSGVLDPSVLQLIGGMGESLAHAASSRSTPVGAFGAFRALGNPDVQRAMGLLLAFAADFGRRLGTSSTTPTRT